MKLRRLFCALLCAALLAGTAPAAQAAGLRASVATGKVTINGHAIDNSTAQYPLLVYKDITYFPMTYYLCRNLGLTTDWDNGSRTLCITPNGISAQYVADTGHTPKRGTVAVTRADYTVLVNTEKVDSSRAKWPLLNYSGVTYFPLTWAFAVEKFGWDYHWDAENGLRIDSEDGASTWGPELDIPPIGIVQDPPVSTGERSESELINSASRAWATAAWGSSPEKLAVDTADWNLEGIKKAIGGALVEHVKGTLLEGRLTEVTIPYTFQYPDSVKAGDVLKVPYTASYHGDERVLPSGRTFTPTSTSEEATASVRLTGPGSGAGTDSAFQAGQEIYRKLEACLKLADMEAGSQDDIGAMIRAAIDARLAQAGLADQYRIQALSLGSYTQPGGMAAGERQTVSFQAVFSPLEGDGEDFSLSGQAVLTAR